MLRLLLVKDDRIIRNIPLSVGDMPSERFDEEMDGFLEKLAKYEQITEALTNLNRLRMLRYLMDQEDFTHSFSDFLRELGMNPKIVREHTSKLREAGYVEPMGRGKYRFSERGRALFMTAGLAVMSLVEVLEEQV